MRHPPRDTLRTYVRGESDLPSRLLVEAHLALCRTCRTIVREDRGPAASVEAAPGEGGAVPAFERVWEAIERAQAERFGTPAVLPPSVLSALPPQAAWRWIVLSRRRVRTALLVRDPDTGARLYLSQYAPLSRFPTHRHLGVEETVVLAGGYTDGDAHVEAGDWLVATPGTEHAPATGADEECWCLSRVEPPGIRFRGWRRFVQRFVADA